MILEPEKELPVDRGTGNEAMHVPVRIYVKTIEADYDLRWEWPYDVVHTLKTEDLEAVEANASAAAQSGYTRARLMGMSHGEAFTQIAGYLGAACQKALWQRFVVAAAKQGKESWLVPTQAGA